ncbi:putative ionic transporter integral membrane protein ChaA [Mycobacterium xenopi 3993]|nr:putative ionic transporter integral membrane protein ChaA [Mycobacterium xenopi 3993]
MLLAGAVLAASTTPRWSHTESASRRIAGARGGGDHHRGGADCHADGVRRRQIGHAGARYRVRAVIITTTDRRLVAADRFTALWRNVVQRQRKCAALATVTTLATLSLVLPTFTTSQPGPSFRPPAQLRRARVARALSAVRVHPDRATPRFLSAGQPTRRHRRRKPACAATNRPASAGEPRAAAGRARRGGGLAKVESPVVERAVTAIGFPQSFVGVVIAMLVLLPETLAAVRAARRAASKSASTWPTARRCQHRAHHPPIALASLWLSARCCWAWVHPVGAAGADRRGRCADRRARRATRYRARCIWCCGRIRVLAVIP